MSQTKINELRKYFENEIVEKRIRAYAITFDCLAKRNPMSEKTDAIAIEWYSSDNDQRTTYYYPYKRVAGDTFDFGEPWGVMTD